MGSLLACKIFWLSQQQSWGIWTSRICHYITRWFAKCWIALKPWAAITQKCDTISQKNTRPWFINRQLWPSIKQGVPQKGRKHNISTFNHSIKFSAGQGLEFLKTHSENSYKKMLQKIYSNSPSNKPRYNSWCLFFIVSEISNKEKILLQTETFSHQILFWKPYQLLNYRHIIVQLIYIEMPIQEVWH